MHLLSVLGIGKDCGLDTVGEAIYNVELHAGQLFAWHSLNEQLRMIYSEWNTVKLNSDFTKDSPIDEVTNWMKNTEISLKDELGGRHEDGLGWNSYGVFCGECPQITCVGCKSNVRGKCYV